MALMDTVLKFIGSKWFTLILGLVLMGVLPFTYHNFMVVYSAGQMSKFWWIVAVFIINVLSVGLCVYKFMGQLKAKPQISNQSW